MARSSSLAASRAAVREYLKGVGEGGTFTLLDLRHAVPGFNQVDRRMRELRAAEPMPWVIHSALTRRGLPTDTYFIERIGGDRLPRTPSARVRREVFEAAGHRCQVCGVAANEEYEDYPGELARLQLGHWRPMDQGGSRTDKANLRAECHRCNGGIRNRTGAVTDRANLEARARALNARSRQRLLSWLEQNRREEDDDERIYYEARQLPPSELVSFVESLASVVRGRVT